MDKVLQTITAACCAIIGFLYGELNGLFYTLLAFVILDYLSGVIAAIGTKTLSSAVGFRGIAKKILILILVAIGHLLDTQILGASSGSMIQSAVSGFYIINEALSILENAARLGLPLPKKLIKALAQLKSEEEKHE